MKFFSQAVWFYSAFFVILVLAFVVTNIPGAGDSAWLSIQVEVLNAFLMPVVVGFLFILARKQGVLPDKYR